MSSMYDYDCLYGLNPSIYIDTGGARVVQSRFTEKANSIYERQACHPRKGESHLDTGEGLQSCIFIAHQFGPCHIAQTPGDPLMQDSLSSP